MTLGRDFRRDSSHKLCIHVRRGDFERTRFTLSTAEFIEPATTAIFYYLRKKQGIRGDISLVIFGADDDFVETLQPNMDLFNVVYRPSLPTRGHDQAFAHQFCDSILLSSSGSTFGWWIAYLLPEETPVFYNENVVKNRSLNERDFNNFYPKQWKRISVEENATISIFLDYE